MELKPGYKQTEVGVIPEDWRVCQLGEVCSVLRGGSPRPIENYLTNREDGINWIKIGDVGAGAKYIDATSEKILPSGISRSRYVQPGDFLLSNSMSFGRPYILRTEGCIHDGWLVIGDYQESFSTEYLYYCLSSIGVLSQYARFAAGSSVLNLNKDIVSKVHVAIPEPKEQRSISEVLGDLDSLLGELEELITKKRNIKQAAMQELLTGKRRLPGFEGEWETKSIGSHIDLLTGYPFPSQQYRSSGVRLLRGSNVKRGQANWSDELVQHWPSLTPEVAPYLLREGDLVIAMDGSLVGRSYARLTSSDLPALLLQRVARIRSSTLDIGFLTQFVGSKEFISHCDAVKTVTAIPHISPADIRSFKISIPPDIKEQAAISDLLSEMDAEIDVLEKRLNKTRALKQAMMQELLTGRIRLV
jgi:type I restriction enzyme S subunit